MVAKGAGLGGNLGVEEHLIFVVARLYSDRCSCGEDLGAVVRVPSALLKLEGSSRDCGEGAHGVLLGVVVCASESRDQWQGIFYL